MHVVCSRSDFSRHRNQSTGPPCTGPPGNHTAVHHHHRAQPPLQPGQVRLRARAETVYSAEWSAEEQVGPLLHDHGLPSMTCIVALENYCSITGLHAFWSHDLQIVARAQFCPSQHPTVSHSVSIHLFSWCNRMCWIRRWTNSSHPRTLHWSGTCASRPRFRRRACVTSRCALSGSPAVRLALESLCISFHCFMCDVSLSLMACREPNTHPEIMRTLPLVSRNGPALYHNLVLNITKQLGIQVLAAVRQWLGYLIFLTWI